MDLIHELPHMVDIKGMEVSINTSFRTSIMFEEMFKEELTNQEFWNKALKLYYPIMDKTIMDNELEDIKLYEHIRDNSDEATKQILWFHRCGKEELKDKEGKSQKEILSYAYDWDLIVGAFKNQYNTNLYKDDLHWWEFKAYFNALKPDNEICKRMSIRGIDINKVSKEQQDYYIEAKKAYAIPKALEEIEEEDEFDKMMMNGGDIAAFERN